MSDNIKRLVVDKASASVIREAAIAEGMVTLRTDGIAKLKAGITTVEEVLRETS
ncbi:MAG: hypothetical protein JNL74_16195 [Fibrobacteres bacterium]|nr:hypothetical protein [Fibrobacterota bacterium]